MSRKSYVEPQMKDGLKDHVLEPHADYERLKAWYLKDPKQGRMMSCLILFTVEGIVIMGDLTPCQSGVISAYGYSLAWFTGQLSEDYLCEKFLQKEFRPDKAVREFKDMILYRRRDATLHPRVTFSKVPPPHFSKEDARDAWDWIERRVDELNPYEFYEEFSNLFGTSPDGSYGYNLGDAGWLCAIQQKFAALYQAQLAKELTTVEGA